MMLGPDEECEGLYHHPYLLIHLEEETRLEWWRVPE